MIGEHRLWDDDDVNSRNNSIFILYILLFIKTCIDILLLILLCIYIRPGWPTRYIVWALLTGCCSSVLWNAWKLKTTIIKRCHICIEIQLWNWRALSCRHETHCVPHMCSTSEVCFKITLNIFLDTSIQILFFLIIKIDNFRGVLSDMSAKKTTPCSTPSGATIRSIVAPLISASDVSIKLKLAWILWSRKHFFRYWK